MNKKYEKPDKERAGNTIKYCIAVFDLQKVFT